MAILIPIIKDSEDSHTVVYSYIRESWEPDPQRPSRNLRGADQIGKLGIDKTTGTVVRLVDIPDQFLEFYLPRVTRMLKKAFERQDFADRLDYQA